MAEQPREVGAMAGGDQQGEEPGRLLTSDTGPMQTRSQRVSEVKGCRHTTQEKLIDVVHLSSHSSH